MYARPDTAVQILSQPKLRYGFISHFYCCILWHQAVRPEAVFSPHNFYFFFFLTVAAKNDILPFCLCCMSNETVFNLQSLGIVSSFAQLNVEIHFCFNLQVISNKRNDS